MKSLVLCLAAIVVAFVASEARACNRGGSFAFSSGGGYYAQACHASSQLDIIDLERARRFRFFNNGIRGQALDINAAGAVDVRFGPFGNVRRIRTF